jgi:hypothetical protein
MTLMTTATYLVLLYGDENVWRARSDAELAALDESHRTFRDRAEQNGHTIVGSHELEYAKDALVVRRSRHGDPVVSDGPFAETIEQVGGFYLVRTADPRGLADLVAGMLTEDADIRRARHSEEEG